MKKNIIKGIIYAVFPILFNVLFFALKGAKGATASVWITYAWVHLAYIIMVCSSFFIKKTRQIMTLTFTAGTIAAVYFGLELLTAIPFLIIRFEKITLALVFQLPLLCVFVVIFLLNLLATDHTEKEEKIREGEINFIRTASYKVQGLMDIADDAELKKQLEKTYDVINASPTKSCQEAKEQEKEIMIMLVDLSIALEENNFEEAKKLNKKIQLFVNERNRIVKLSY